MIHNSIVWRVCLAWLNLWCSFKSTRTAAVASAFGSLWKQHFLIGGWNVAHQHTKNLPKTFLRTFCKILPNKLAHNLTIYPFDPPFSQTYFILSFIKFHSRKGKKWLQFRTRLAVSKIPLLSQHNTFLLSTETMCTGKISTASNE